MRIGCHLGLAELSETAKIQTALKVRGADALQTFLANPQNWTKPKQDPHMEEVTSALKADGVTLYFHAPYVVNVASTNNRIRIPSRALVTVHAKWAGQLGASGLIVHGGHVTKDDDPQVGVDNWRKFFSNAVKESGLPSGFEVPILLENTAGGTYAMTRHLDRIAALWDGIGEFNPGFCLDICHAHASGEDLISIVDRVKAITGRIDLVHANSSKDEAGSARDRHANYDDGLIDPEVIVDIVKSTGSNVILETPGPAEIHAKDITFLRERLGLE
jgi:deoxyribonuclease IV